MASPSWAFFIGEFMIETVECPVCTGKQNVAPRYKDRSIKIRCHICHAEFIYSVNTKKAYPLTGRKTSSGIRFW